MDESTDAHEGFSRKDLDRVIRRAVELQFDAGSGSHQLARIDEHEVRRIGTEVGIEDRFLRQAIGEVRAEHLVGRPPEDRGLVTRWVGSRHVRVHRVVPGTAAEVERALADHLRVAETLSPVRNRHGRSLWHPEEGIGAQLRRGVRWGGYRYELARVSGLEVAVMAMEDGFVLVSLTADLQRARNEAGLGGALGGGSCLASVGVVASLVAGAPLVAIPAGIAAGVVGGFGGLRIAHGSYRRRTERITLALEGILDRLETGAPLGGRNDRPPARRRRGPT